MQTIPIKLYKQTFVHFACSTSRLHMFKESQPYKPWRQRLTPHIEPGNARCMTSQAPLQRRRRHMTDLANQMHPFLIIQETSDAKKQG